jgi:malic enzyme
MIIKILKQRGEQEVNVVVLDRKGKIHHRKAQSVAQAKQWVYNRFEEITCEVEYY